MSRVAHKDLCKIKHVVSRGPLEVVTTDAAGNLATDGGEIFARMGASERQIDKNSEGVALAMALQDPDFVAEETFGIRGGWGNFEGENAFGINFAAVVAHDLIEPGRGRLALGGGVGIGASKGTVGVRLGGQLTW